MGHHLLFLFLFLFLFLQLLSLLLLLEGSRVLFGQDGSRNRADHHTLPGTGRVDIIFPHQLGITAERLSDLENLAPDRRHGLLHLVIDVGAGAGGDVDSKLFDMASSADEGAPVSFPQSQRLIGSPGYRAAG